MQAALGGVLRSENAHFSTVWDHASAQQRLLLQALAVEPGHALAADYRRRHDLPSPSTVQSAGDRRWSVRSSSPTSAATCGIVEPFLAEWVRDRFGGAA